MNYSENNQGVHTDQVLKNVLIPNVNTAYRLTLFLWNPTTDAGAGTITFLVQYTKPFGGSAFESATLNLASGPAVSVGIDKTIWAQAGTPLQYSVLGGGTYGTATYSYLLAMDDMSHSSNEDGGGECGSIIPVPLPIPANCCGRCRRNPCNCNQQQQQPNIIVIPVGGQPQYPMLPQRQQRYLPYADDDDGYNGPWGCESCP